ncbi:RsmE family RNA methyltransferase [candidate division WOR-3 bacterium]|uniref:Ribosomal RNA small subunit methyltransferase E n=1 Tax=candidate division WOR-3 bacterium TaxID=2052148 RepID=A0A9D5K955_UNCW3|nr:RsmE family RNA methyltransferase [candidate division WOR-3 bacterium]MBD3364628.1 RsmE family RNA methyltransferase [candidate division WOR-3 bacterium]
MKELFYTPPDRISGGRIKIVGEEAKHIFKVKRHRKGSQILISDGVGMEYKVLVESATEGLVEGQVISTRRKPREALLEVTLGFGIIKAPRIEVLFEKCTEMGVTAFQPLATSRTVPRWEDGEKKLNRFQKVIISAMKQSMRSICPRILPLLDLRDFITRIIHYDHTLVAWEDARHRLRERLIQRRVRRLLLIIGPEGGFAPDEIEELTAAGAKVFSLGRRRLRTETAAVAGLANVYNIYDV